MLEALQMSPHGAVSGVTGLPSIALECCNSILIDCGLFQEVETSPNGSKFEHLALDFLLPHITRTKII